MGYQHQRGKRGIDTGIGYAVFYCPLGRSGSEGAHERLGKYISDKPEHAGKREYHLQRICKHAGGLLSVLLSEQDGYAYRRACGDQIGAAEHDHYDRHYQIYGGEGILTDKAPDKQPVRYLVER